MTVRIRNKSIRTYSTPNGGWARYPFMLMNIGDRMPVASKNVARRSHEYGERYGMKFRTGKIDGQYFVERIG
jgi:hypothetical protein